MDSSVQGYLAHAIAPSTQLTYCSASRRYLDFCTQFGFPSLPLNQITVLRFVAHLANSGLTYQFIRVYLSALRFLQIRSGLPDRVLDSDMMLTYVLRGIHRSSPPVPPRHRLPITADIMRVLFNAWSNAPEAGCYDVSMLWAAACVGFFGFMRAGEFTCSSWRTFTADMLSPRDISVDSHEDPGMVSILLRRSKTDPFGVGVTIHLGRTHQDICPVSALLGYIARRGQSYGPLFMFQDGTPLSKQRLMRQVRQALESQGFNSSGFTGIVLEWAQPHQRHSQESKIPSFRLWVAGNQLHTSATSVLQSKLLHHCHPGFCSQPLARSQCSDTQPLLLCVEPFFLHSSTPAHSSSCFQTLSRTYL